MCIRSYKDSHIQRTRYGNDFWRFLTEYESWADWSHDQLCDYSCIDEMSLIKGIYDRLSHDI